MRTKLHVHAYISYPSNTGLGARIESDAAEAADFAMYQRHMKRRVSHARTQLHSVSDLQDRSART